MTNGQARAIDQLRGFAKPHRYRVVADQEGFPIIPCRLGVIEWYHETGERLAAFTDRPQMHGRLLALPWVICRQRGDQEIRVSFPADRLAEVARLLGARRRRTLAPEAARGIGGQDGVQSDFPAPGTHGSHHPIGRDSPWP